MMGGITVLNEFNDCWKIMAVLFIIGIVSTIIIFLFEYEDFELGFLISIPCWGLIGLCLLICLVVTTDKYEVLISDSVSMKEFNERYEIVDQRGDIYVIKEKGNKND